MDYFEIPTWKEYQHYKDRHPPWIKLHTSLLTSNTWVMLDDASRVLAVACMLIASRTDGKVPNDPGYIKRVAYLSSVDFAPLLSVGFLKPSSEMLASASTVQAKATTEKRRGETEKRRGETDLPPSECKASPSKFSANAYLDRKGVSQGVIDDWIALRKSKKAPVTETAITGIENEAGKAMLSLEDALRCCCQNGWQGFKAEWVTKGASNGKQSRLEQLQQCADELTGRNRSGARTFDGYATPVD